MNNIGPGIVYNNLILYYDVANYYSYNGLNNPNFITDLSNVLLSGSLQNITTSLSNLGVLSFNGTNSYISGSQSLGLTTNISINTWMYLNSLNTSSIFNSWSASTINTSAPIARIQSITGTTNFKTGTNWTQTLKNIPTVGNVLLAYFGWFNSLGITSIVQSGTNANWTNLGSTNNGTCYFSLWMLPVTSGTGQTSSVYFNAVSRFWTGTIEEVSGLATTSLLDVQSTHTSTDPLYNTGNTPTTTVPNEYWVNLWYYYDSTGLTGTETLTAAGQGYTVFNPTNVQWNPINGGNGSATLSFEGMFSAYQIVSSIGVAGGLGTDATAGNTGIPNFGWAVTLKSGSTNVASLSTSFGLVQKNGNIFARTNSDYNLNANLSLNTWANVCVVYSGIGASVYINGNLINYNPNAIISLGINSFNIGSNGINPNIELLNGNLGPLSIYNVSLTTSQVLQNFNAFRSRFGL